MISCSDDVEDPQVPINLLAHLPIRMLRLTQFKDFMSLDLSMLVNLIKQILIYCRLRLNILREA